MFTNEACSEVAGNRVATSGKRPKISENPVLLLPMALKLIHSFSRDEWANICVNITADK
jgi:hypothetical protein